MTPEELFEMHQEILSKLLDGSPIDVALEKKIHDFLLVTNTKADAYTEIVQRLSYVLRSFNQTADETCSMRNLISTERIRRRETQ